MSSKGAPQRIARGVQDVRVHDIHLLGEEGLRGQRKDLGDERRVFFFQKNGNGIQKRAARFAALLEDDLGRQALRRLPAVEWVVVVRQQVHEVRLGIRVVQDHWRREAAQQG